VTASARPPFTASARSGLFRLDAAACWAGDDLTVTVTGGERPHIGCVVVARPHPATDDPARTSVTSSVLCFPPHREEPLVRPIAEALARGLGATVVVAAGVHTEGLTPAGVAAYLRLGKRLAERLMRVLTR
jgi:hypothetical protein